MLIQRSRLREQLLLDLYRLINCLTYMALFTPTYTNQRDITSYHFLVLTPAVKKSKLSEINFFIQLTFAQNGVIKIEQYLYIWDLDDSILTNFSQIRNSIQFTQFDSGSQPNCNFCNPCTWLMVPAKLTGAPRHLYWVRL